MLIDKVIDPNLNNHGIYAFVKLSKLTEVEMGTKYALVPLEVRYRYSNKEVKKDVETAQSLVEEFFKHNIGRLPYRSETLKIIEKHVEKTNKVSES